jgi:hypothetical protein
MTDALGEGAEETGRKWACRFKVEAKGLVPPS